VSGGGHDKGENSSAKGVGAYREKEMAGWERTRGVGKKVQTLLMKIRIIQNQEL